MTTNAQPIAVDYSNDELRILVEEYLSMQKTDFSLKGVCSYALYWAMEEGRTGEASNTIYGSSQLQENDCQRIRQILESIVKDGRICRVVGDDRMYLKQY